MACFVDPVGRERVLRCGIPDSLLVPVAAVDEDAIRQHVGDVERVLSAARPNRALLVAARQLPTPDETLPIWALPASATFLTPLQVWVHISYTRYRSAYRKAFPSEVLDKKVLSHAENRRSAALKGFKYVRITPVSRSANSSSAFSEEWGVARYLSLGQKAANHGARIQYADLTGLMLLMDMKLGGGVMDAVNEGQRLIRTPA